MTFRSEPDDLPLHAAIRRWLVAYARTPDELKDGVVAEMLTELNALLQGRSGGPKPCRGRSATG